MQWLPDDTVVRFDLQRYWIPQRFQRHTDNVTLAGDAAHSMPPHRGQGLNHAIHDALNFVEAVKKIQADPESQAQVLRSYNDEVAERSRKETLMSLGAAGATYGTFKDSAQVKYGLVRSPEG